jgi:hypothetical protein
MLNGGSVDHDCLLYVCRVVAASLLIGSTGTIMRGELAIM